MNLEDKIDCSNFSVTGYPPVIRKDSVIYMHGLAVYLKRGLPLARDLSAENSSSIIVLLLFPSSTLLFAHGFWWLDEVLSIKPSANVFVFREFNVHHMNWLNYPGGTNRPGELCCYFSSTNDLTQKVNFPTRIPDRDFHNPALLDLYHSFYPSISSIVAFPPLEKSDHVSFH